jgi:hypothetical protein
MQNTHTPPPPPPRLARARWPKLRCLHAGASPPRRWHRHAPDFSSCFFSASTVAVAARSSVKLSLERNCTVNFTIFNAAVGVAAQGAPQIVDRPPGTRSRPAGVRRAAGRHHSPGTVTWRMRIATATRRAMATASSAATLSRRLQKFGGNSVWEEVSRGCSRAHSRGSRPPGWRDCIPPLPPPPPCPRPPSRRCSSRRWLAARAR